jgi:hypothetical protein
MARCTVTLAHADAAAPEAATQIWDTLNSLAAATDGVLSGVEARVASDRGAWPPRQRVFQMRSRAPGTCPRFDAGIACDAGRLAALAARLAAARARVDAVAALRQRARALLLGRLPLHVRAQCV